MMIRFLNTIILITQIQIILIINYVANDSVDPNYLFETNEILNSTALPTLSNGHIAFVIYDDSIYMNGLYSGFMSNSHKARIPNYANIQLDKCKILHVNNSSLCKYTLDIENGFFKTTLYEENFTITLKTYPHRFFEHVIINNITIIRNSPNINGNYTVKIAQNAVPDSVDLKLKATGMDNGFIFKNWETVENEDYNYQNNVIDIHMIYEMIPEYVQIYDEENVKSFIWITTVGYYYDNLLSDMIILFGMKDIFLLHKLQWEIFWTNCGITVRNNNDLAKSIHASLFALGSSLPAIYTDQSYEFYGLSLSGIGMGSSRHNLNTSKHNGHSFWDTEMWIQPAVLLLEPEWSKSLLHYRYLTFNAAIDNAKSTGYYGAKYPRASALTGREVTTSCCTTELKYEQYISGVIAFAIRSHLYATHDMDWFKNEGCEIAHEIALFWENRVMYNKSIGFFDINGVMGPDKNQWNVNNDIFTNVIAAYSLYFGEFSSCICKKFYPDKYYITDQWSRIAKSIKLNYDMDNMLYRQNDDYLVNTLMAEANTILLGYPLQYPMDNKIKRNNLYLYKNTTTINSSAMARAMYAIGYLDIDEEPDNIVFQNIYEPFIRQPFYVWHEIDEEHYNANNNINGIENFLPGAASFIQLIINGYAGIRIKNDYLEIRNPRLPPNTTNLELNGITYLGVKFHMEITNYSYRFYSMKIDADYQIFVNDKTFNKELLQQTYFSFDQIIKIKSKYFTYFDDCKLPLNIIGIKSAAKSNLIFTNLYYKFNVILIIITIFNTEFCGRVFSLLI